MHPKDLVFKYCKFPQIKQIGYNLKKDILKELSTILRSNTNKILIEKIFSKKITYNNIYFFEEMGFKLRFESGNLIFKNNIDMPPIPINQQLYFHYKFITKLRTFDKCKIFFDDLGFLNENIYKIEYNFDPNYQIINKIFINENEYIQIEYFEKNKIDLYTGILRDKLRIANTLIFNTEEKCKRFYVFWEDNIDDDSYFETFINNIIDFIEAQDNNINLKEYNLTTNKNNEILIEDLNKLIEWKDVTSPLDNVTSSERYYIHFKKNLENHNEGYLNINELDLYISNLDLNFVKNDAVLKYLFNLNFKIQKDYNKKLIDFMNKKIMMLENPCYGLFNNNLLIEVNNKLIEVNNKSIEVNTKLIEVTK